VRYLPNGESSLGSVDVTVHFDSIDAQVAESVQEAQLAFSEGSYRPGAIVTACQTAPLTPAEGESP